MDNMALESSTMTYMGAIKENCSITVVKR
uniref:Transposase n=1 Tax=Parastrongyloides trichosuri TaxID=131310 RepID=A0A0N5A6F4_PARTI